MWAPTARSVEVVLYRGDAELLYPLAPEALGYHAATVPGAAAGDRYRYRLDGGDPLPDPASRFQPDGVHGPSQIVDPDAFPWTDGDWAGLDPDGLVIYELHVGTFTAGGTFDAAIERLGELARLGVSAIELMPIANFPGARNWGYDGVDLYAPATAYGGPEGFKRLVDAAHHRGLGVLLDVVYNHVGPEGNYLPAVTGGQFFSARKGTHWGEAINYDGPGSAGVRDFVVQNALHWAHEYHVDGLRLDAVHAIVDESPVHILEEIASALHELEPPRLVIAEDSTNDARLLRPRGEGGLGLDAVWADDLHHQLRRLVAGDRESWFATFGGSVEEVVDTLRHGWWREGERTAARDPNARASAAALPTRAFVHCIQNHDQVGNRALGDRLNHVVSAPVYRALSALLLLSPYTPLLWMGQEWAASSPFLYFTDHPEPLGRLVTQGRREEFKDFAAFSDPDLRERIPDPQARATFERSRLRWDERAAPGHAGTAELYRTLLALRSGTPALRERGREHFSVVALTEGALALRRDGSGGAVLLVVGFGGEVRLRPAERAETRAPDGRTWRLVLATEEPRFGGSGDWGSIDATGALELHAPGAVVLEG